MTRRWMIILSGIFAILMVYEVFNNQLSFILLILGVIMIIANKRISKEKSNRVLFLGIIFLLLALINSRFVLAALIIGGILLVGNYPDLFHSLRTTLTHRKHKVDETDFMMVQFSDEQEEQVHLERNPWLGSHEKTTEAVYRWEDVNFTKAIGHTVFDLGNTILPKEQNIMLIRVGIGDTKIIIPEEVAISLDVSILNGKVIIGQEQISMSNETFKWQSKHYHKSTRKVKLVANVLFGKVEVIFL